ncbi:hypothetical protein GINT2_000494 [Glugoides intestinalis]
MYENLVAFLLGKKTELSEEELNEFMELLVRAIDVEEEYSTLEKQSVIENIVNSVAVEDQNERVIISNAIENILEFDTNATESEESDNQDIFVDKSRDELPLKQRKVKRGNFGNRSESSIKKEELKAHLENSVIDVEEKQEKIDIQEDNCDNAKRVKPSENIAEETEKPSKIFGNKGESLAFEFDIGDLEENHQDGPSFSFKLDES